MDILKHSFKFLRQFYITPDKNLKLVLSNFLDTNSIESHKGVTRTVYGVVRQELALDTIISRLTGRTPGKIETDVLILLRIGIYLLVYSKSYPDYAVVNEAVRLSKRRSKGFVNAVLRRCARERDSIVAIVDRLEDPHVKYSMANILIDNLKAIYEDLGGVTLALEYLDREPVFHIRLNSKHFSYEKLKEILGGAGLLFKELKQFDSFEVEGFGGAGGRLRQLLKEAEYFYFQNTASQLVSIIASRYAVNTVLDCCTAPGAKSVTLSLLNPNLKIIANDIDERRLLMVKEFCTAYSIHNIKPVISDIKTLCFKGHFGLVILDAPCTSSGTLRKNPDLKLKITRELVDKNAENQYWMLQSVLKNLSADYILYSVCSFIADETEHVLERTLNESEKVFEIMDLSSILEEYGFSFKKGKYGFYLLPNEELKNDLFYLSLLKPAVQVPY